MFLLFSQRSVVSLGNILNSEGGGGVVTENFANSEGFWLLYCAANNTFTFPYFFHIIKQILQNNWFVGCEWRIYLGCSKINSYIQKLICILLREGRQLLRVWILNKNAQISISSILRSKNQEKVHIFYVICC